MEIIGAKPNKQKKKPYIFISSIIVAVLVVIGITAGVMCMTHKQPTINQINEVQQYQQLKDSFAVQGITYTKEDYDQDKDIINSAIDASGKIVISPEQQKKLSNAYKQSVNKNQQTLDETNKLTSVKDISTVAQVQDLVVDKVNTMLQFIADDYGWPENKYGEKYTRWRNYIKQLDKYAQNETPMESIYSNKFPLSLQANELRLSVYDTIQFSMSNSISEGREFYLVDWYKLGHPSLGKITSFTLTNQRVKITPFVSSNLQAHIASSNGNFIVYLRPGAVHGLSTYLIIDISQDNI